jgi:MFS family permease
MTTQVDESSQAPTSPSVRTMWPLLLASAAILMITMGARQSTGLFVSPINTATGVGIVSISFALAIGQFMWGAVQPVFGAVADKYGASRVIIFGAFLLAVGMALTPFAHTQLGLIVAMGLLTASGAGAGSFSILIGATAQQLPAEKRSFAAGFVNAGGSFGQFVFAPFLQAIISASGWVVAMFSMAVVSLLTIPLTWPLRARRDLVPKDVKLPTTPSAVVNDIGLKRQLREALRNPSYLLLHAGFFTCGFHIAFLVTHLPGEVALCSLSTSVASNALALIGLFNIAGSLSVGWLGQRFRMKYLLALMYASRAALIAVYLIAPKTSLTFYIFAAGLGFTWLATVPPTAGIVGKLFGTRYLGTLFGLTLLTHQIGGFLGAYLGGIVFARNENYQWMWYADIALAVAAALINLPIKEARPKPLLVAAPA